MPKGVVALAAAFCLLAPALFTSPAFDHPLLDWLGLGLVPPMTNDYVPIFPWFGVVLIGVLSGRTLTAGGRTPPLARWHAAGGLAGALAAAGRRSLPIYLLHQPVLLAVLYGVLQATGPNPAAEARPFVAECEANCRTGTIGAETCRAACACMVGRLKVENLWRGVLENRLAAQDQARVSGLAQQCLRSAASPSGASSSE
jgi:uncharacterized membrane protein